MSHYSILAISLALILLASGCIPIPIIVPPLEFEASAGAMISQEPASGAHEFGAAFPISATLRPMQSFFSMETRFIDLGAGYHILPSTNRGFNHGPNIDLAWLLAVPHPDFLDSAFDTDSRARLGLRLRGQAYLGGPDGMVGRGASFQVFFERVSFRTELYDRCSFSFAGDSDADSSVVNKRYGAFCSDGVTWGESSSGLFAETSYARIHARDQWVFSLGLKWRLPLRVSLEYLVGER